MAHFIKKLAGGWSKDGAILVFAKVTGWLRNYSPSMIVVPYCLRLTDSQVGRLVSIFVTTKPEGNYNLFHFSDY